MGTAERRLEMLKYLCRVRKTTTQELSEKFGVSVRTIQRDITEIELTLRVPLETRSGKYNGGIYVLGNYQFDRAYMCDDELQLLHKIRILTENQLNQEEKLLLNQIIKKYTKSA